MPRAAQAPLRMQRDQRPRGVAGKRRYPARLPRPQHTRPLQPRPWTCSSRIWWRVPCDWPRSAAQRRSRQPTCASPEWRCLGMPRGLLRPCPGGEVLVPMRTRRPCSMGGGAGPCQSGREHARACLCRRACGRAPARPPARLPPRSRACRPWAPTRPLPCSPPRTLQEGAHPVRSAAGLLPGGRGRRGRPSLPGGVRAAEPQSVAQARKVSAGERAALGPGPAPVRGCRRRGMKAALVARRPSRFTAATRFASQAVGQGGRGRPEADQDDRAAGQASQTRSWRVGRGSSGRPTWSKRRRCRGRRCPSCACGTHGRGASKRRAPGGRTVQQRRRRSDRGPVDRGRGDR